MPRIDLVPGHFSWVDLVTTDLEAATGFYAELLGLEAEASPMSHGSYVMLKKDGQEVAGAIAMPPGSENDFPPSWVSYVLVEDVDDARERCAALGGTNLMTREIEGAGRMAMIQDPSGGALGLWEAQGFTGAGLFNEPGTLTWNELVTPDVDACLPFYGQLLGWEWTDVPMHDGSVYKMCMVGGRPNGGVMEMTSDWPEHTPPHWAVYFHVADVDAYAARVGELGGRVLMAPWDVPTVGRIAVCQDPQGAVFNLFLPAERPSE